MRSLVTLHTLFVLLAGSGMVLMGVSYITLTAWTAAMVGAVLLLVAAIMLWLYALRQVCGVATQTQDRPLSAALLVRLYFVLPELLNQALAGRSVKRVDRALPFSLIVFSVMLLAAVVIAPYLVPLVLLSTLLVMLRQLHQWRWAVSHLNQAASATLAAGTERKQLPVSLELFGCVLLNLLLAGIVVVLFNAFFVVPFEGRISRAQQKLVEIELKQAMELGSAYLADHADQRITTPQQLAALGWQETDRIRLVQVDLTAKGGSITMQYTQRTGSRREPVTVKTVYDGETVRMERMP